MERHQLSGGLRLMTPPSVNRAFASRFRGCQGRRPPKVSQPITFSHRGGRIPASWAMVPESSAQGMSSSRSRASRSRRWSPRKEGSACALLAKYEKPKRPGSGWHLLPGWLHTGPGCWLACAEHQTSNPHCPPEHQPPTSVTELVEPNPLQSRTLLSSAQRRSEPFRQQPSASPPISSDDTPISRSFRANQFIETQQKRGISA